MILAQNGGIFARVYPTVTPFGQAFLRVNPVVVLRSPLTAETPRAQSVRVAPDIHHLLALIAGSFARRGLNAGARLGFMVYFLRVIQGKFDGSNEHPSFVGRVSPAISGTMTKTLEPAIKRCGR